MSKSDNIVVRHGDRCDGMSKKVSKHTAAGPYLGFGLQTVRLCARLLREPRDAYVYVEHDDDVSVHYADGTKLFEQTKSATSQNPVADWAVDLWKTIHNWFEEHAPFGEGHGKRFRLYVTPKHIGKFVAAFSSAATLNDVLSVVANVSVEVSADKKKTTAFKFAKSFLEADEKDRAGLLLNFELLGDEDPLEPIRELFRAGASEQVVEKTVAYALGEAKRQTDALLRAKKPGGLNAGEFQSVVRDFVQRVNLPALFAFDPTPPGVSQIIEKFSCRPTFVQQLELIDASKDQQLNAVSDYLRAATHKTEWAVEGILLPHSLDQWTDDLLARHQAIFDSITSMHAHLDEKKQGMAIYAECRRAGMQLQGKTVPEHFTHGCYNDLADLRKVGWHPDYDKLLE